MHDFPDLKPACSLIRCCSMVGAIMVNIIVSIEFDIMVT